MTELEVAITRPRRWDEPFGEMTDRDAEQLLRIEPFRSIDPEAFPVALPLTGILRGDTRIVRYEAGDLIVREGDYGHSAFLVLSGTVRVVLEQLNPALLGRDQPARRGWRQAIAQLWRNARLPEVRRAIVPGAQVFESEEWAPRPLAGTPIPIGSRQQEGALRIFLQDVPRLLEHTGTVQLGAGEMFGELAALARTQRTATVLADAPTILLEIRWQGLRDLMRRTPALSAHVERLYRENSLHVHLRETPLLADLPPASIEKVAAGTIFESYGNFDWHADFVAHRHAEAGEQLAMEPLIAAAGDRPTGLYLIRSGFARVSRRHGHGHQTLAYLGKGQVFGLEELAETFKSGADAPWRFSLRAVGYVDVLRIPSELVYAEVLPNTGFQVANHPLQRGGATHPSATNLRGRWQGGAGRDGAGGSAVAGAPLAPEVTVAAEPPIDSRLLDFITDRRFLNGTQTMLINLDRCTRCDDCVRACAATHDNNPRFVRQGPQHDHLMVANACMHCIDPVCMIGCPTGAIARDADTGTVRINDRTCIGCSTCANSCPYNAIRMVEIREPGGAIMLDEASGQPILKATKCDFCTGQLTGPACQQACPHDALVRLDMGDLPGLARWLG